MTHDATASEKPDLLRAPQSRTAIVRFLIIILVAVAGDLALKSWSFANVAGKPIPAQALRELGEGAIPPHDPLVAVPGVLSLQLTANKGAVFGIGQGGRWVFVLIAVFACAIIARVFWVSRASDWLLHSALGLVTGGALGNLHDRFWYGLVRDMLLLFPETNLPNGWHWPNGSTLVYPWVFNVADAELCVGIGAIIVMMLFFSRHRSAPASKEGKTHTP